MAMSNDETYLFLLDEEKKRKKNLEMDNILNNRERRTAINKYQHSDFDKDRISDGMEIQASLHSEKNVPLHPVIHRRGPTTPGSAHVKGGAICFDFDHSIVNLKVSPTHKIIEGVHQMKTPHPMKLSVNFGEKTNHVTSSTGYKIDLDVHPELYRMSTEKIKKPNISGVIKNMTGIKKEGKKDRDEINDLSNRLAGFIQGQHKKESIVMAGKNDLDFSVVGISRGLNTDKLKIKKKLVI